MRYALLLKKNGDEVYKEEVSPSEVEAKFGFGILETVQLFKHILSFLVVFFFKLAH